MRAPNQPRQVKQLPDGTVVVRSSTKHGMRQLRCPRCHNLAAPSRLPNGKQVTRCLNCGAAYTLQSM
jgi:uncharacterized protein (DUF983 family)